MEEQKQQYKQPEGKLGCLWMRKMKNGDTYLIGICTLGGQEYNIVCWPAKNKTNERQPDFSIWESKKQSYEKTTN